MPQSRPFDRCFTCLSATSFRILTRLLLVRRERLELSILSALASKTRVYTIPPPTHYITTGAAAWNRTKLIAMMTALQAARPP